MSRKNIYKKRNYKNPGWQYWIIYRGEEPLGVAKGAKENQAIGAYLSRQDLASDQIGINVEAYSAEPLGEKTETGAREKYFEVLRLLKNPTEKKKVIIHAFTVHVSRKKPKPQLEIPGLPEIDTTLDAL